MNKGYSSYEEIRNRKCPLFGGKAKIHTIEPLQSRENSYCIIFVDGSQAMINQEVYKEITN